MNEQAKEILAQMMQRVLDGVDTAADFAAQEVPIVVEQFLMWHIIESLIFFASGVVLLLIGTAYPIFVFTRKPVKGEETFWFFASGNRSGMESSTMFAAIPIALGCAMMAANIGWLKIWIAPKLYLLEYGASLIK